MKQHRLGPVNFRTLVGRKKEYGNQVQEQEKQDIARDKLSVKEYEDPFRGGKSE